MAKIIRKVSVTATLNALEVGETIELKFKEAKPNAIRTAISRHKSNKYNVTEAGLADSTKITRLS